MGGELQCLLTQLTFKPQPLSPKVRLDNQTAIVTGSNVGIGLETARQLSTHGATRIILGVRDLDKGTSAKNDLVKSNPNCDFQVWQLDLESSESIVIFSEKAKTLDRLDMAILNAAVKQLKWTTTARGHETNLQVNHIGTSLLSVLLLPTLKLTSKQTGKPSRLTFVSSEVHFWTPFKERTSPNILERMDEEESFVEGMERYYTSKLLNVLWFRELASKVGPEEVIINGPNPGFVASQLHRHDSSSGFKVLKKIFSWTSEQGAYFVTDAVVTKQADSHGAYLQEQKITKPSGFVLSAEGKEVQKKVWDETIILFKEEVPDIDIEV